MLHIIRMNDRPKSLKEIARLMNRDDVPNIQYSLRKLLGAALIVRLGAGRSGVTYACTEAGLRVTDDYAVLRRKLLLAEIANVPGFAARLAEASRTLNLLSGIYEEVARVAATHRRGSARAGGRGVASGVSIWAKMKGLGFGQVGQCGMKFGHTGFGGDDAG
jgi:predicted MarR family transcription regulator